jgi:anti-sigma factor RsiW
MNCAEIEILICDYVDGSLGAAQRAEVERHLAGCAACAELVRDSSAAVAFMERASGVEPPQELVNRILFAAPWHKPKSGRFSQLIYSFLQPKFAMGMALTVLSFSMVARNVRQLQPSDLAPAQVWAGIEDRAYRIWARTEKFYDNLKFVYQIQTTLREWQQQAQEPQAGSEGDAPQRQPDRRKVPVKTGAPQAPGGRS